MDTRLLEAEMELTYLNAKFKYDQLIDETRRMREKCRIDHPELDVDLFFMNLCAPPQRIEFREIKM